MFDVKEEKQCTRIIINKQIKSIDEIIKLDSSVIKIIENLKKESLIIAISVIAQLFLGKYIDSKAKKENILKWGSFLYSFGWLIKVFISTAFQIFVVGAYHSITCIFLRTPFDALTYEIAADQEHYVDEFTVLHEMALNFGRVLMIILIIIISFFFDIQWVFVLAALASMVFNLLEKKNSKIIKI